MVEVYESHSSQWVAMVLCLGASASVARAALWPAGGAPWPVDSTVLWGPRCLRWWHCIVGSVAVAVQPTGPCSCGGCCNGVGMFDWAQGGVIDVPSLLQVFVAPRDEVPCVILE